MKFFNEDGHEIPLHIYLKEYGGAEDGAIYRDKDFPKIMFQWRQADWAHVDDFIAPLAAEVITDASELDRELYEEIMIVIEKGFRKMQDSFRKTDERYEAEYRRENFKVIK